MNKTRNTRIPLKEANNLKKILQKANLCDIRLAQMARPVFRYPILYLIVNCT